MIIGSRGANTGGIAADTQTKVRVRGRGSGHEETDGKEAPVPLMVAITSEGCDEDGFVRAVQLMIKLLAEVDGHFHRYCLKNHFDVNSFTEELWRFGDMSMPTEQLLCRHSLLEVLPEASSSCSIRRGKLIAFPERSLTPGLVDQAKKPELYLRPSEGVGKTSLYVKGQGCTSMLTNTSTDSMMSATYAAMPCTAYEWIEDTNWSSSTPIHNATMQQPYDRANYWSPERRWGDHIAARAKSMARATASHPTYETNWEAYSSWWTMAGAFYESLPFEYAPTHPTIDHLNPVEEDVEVPDTLASARSSVIITEIEKEVRDYLNRCLRDDDSE